MISFYSEKLTLQKFSLKCSSILSLRFENHRKSIYEIESHKMTPYFELQTRLRKKLNLFSSYELES